MNREEAIKATKNGAIAACILGSLTLIIVLIAISSNSSGDIALWNDPSILEGGSILTDNRIILYLPDENQEIEIYELYFNEIASVELISDGNSFNDSVYKITSHDPDAWLKIALSVENRGDIKFVEALRSSVGKNNP